MLSGKTAWLLCFVFFQGLSERVGRPLSLIFEFNRKRAYVAVHHSRTTVKAFLCCGEPVAALLGMPEM